MTQIIDGLSPSEVPNIEVFWALKEITELSFTKLAPHLSPVSPPTQSTDFTAPPMRRPGPHPIRASKQACLPPSPALSWTPRGGARSQPAALQQAQRPSFAFAFAAF